MYPHCWSKKLIFNILSLATIVLKELILGIGDDSRARRSVFIHLISQSNINTCSICQRALIKLLVWALSLPEMNWYCSMRWLNPKFSTINHILKGGLACGDRHIWYQTYKHRTVAGSPETFYQHSQPEKTVIVLSLMFYFSNFYVFYILSHAFVPLPIFSFTGTYFYLFYFV